MSYNPFAKKPDLNDAIFQMKFTGKQIKKLAKQAEKEENANKNKVKKAIQEGKIEFAQIYAENAIRKKNESLNFLRLESRMDAVCSRLKTAQSMNAITKQMGSVTKGLDAAMKSMNLEKISTIMEKFENQFEDLDVHSKVMEDSMGSATASTTPQSQVDALIHQVAEENGLEMIKAANAAPIGESSLHEQTASADDDLERRLRAVRN